MSRLLAACLVLSGLWIAAPGAWAEDELARLRGAWLIESDRMDDRGREDQRRILDRMADLKTDASRRALADLLGRAQDVRQVELVLSALLRHADARWIDRAIALAEKDRAGTIRDALGRALGEVRGAEARAHLRGVAFRRAHPKVKVRLAEGLGRIGNAEAVPTLLRALEDEHIGIALRTAILEAVGRIGHAVAVLPLASHLDDPDWRVRDAAARALGMLGGERVVRFLAKALNDEHPRVVETATQALALTERRESVPHLISCLERAHEDDLRVADACARALTLLSGKSLGVDPEAWQAWWTAAQARRGEEEKLPLGVHSVPARYYGLGVRSSKVIFVLDVSRSMGWNGRLDRAKKELVGVLERLPARTRFNLIFFSDSAQPWKRSLVAATPSTVRKAVAKVRSRRPRNATHTRAALEAVFADPDVDTAFLLSDGHPTFSTPTALLTQVREANKYRRLRIHCVAMVIGEAPPGYAALEKHDAMIDFMRRLAADTGGDFQLVK